LVFFRHHDQVFLFIYYIKRVTPFFSKWRK
jgi:hypothetical protein